MLLGLQVRVPRRNGRLRTHRQRKVPIMTQSVVLERRRTGWDVILGLLLIGSSVVILGDTLLATVISVLLIGWLTLFSGVLMLVSALLRIRSGGVWPAAVGGALLTVLGLFILRNPLIGAVTLTLLAGALFLTGGLSRVVAAFHADRYKVTLALSGLVSVGLGVYVLINPVTATLTLLGVLLGIQIMVEGLTLIALGRLRPWRTNR
jgi:membrane protein HdeD